MVVEFEEGRRVYVPSTKTFGTLVREGGILGLKTSYAIVDDLGKKTVFIGDKAEFVYVDSSETVAGGKTEIPQDIVPTLRKNFAPTEARKKTLEFYNLGLEDREKECRNLLGCADKPEDKRPATRKSKRSSRRTKSA